MSSTPESFLYCEKYRPQTIKDCILPDRYREYFNAMVEKGQLQHLLLTGSAGCGKTTISKALCKELGLEYMVINASMNGNIDTLRGQIQSFASTMSFHSPYKVVILDEADYLNSNSTQPALRNFMEEFNENCRFILTANFANKIIEPLKSRCAVVDFNFTKEEKQQMAKAFHKKLKEILIIENIQYDDKVLAQVLVKYFPDFRRVLNELQRHTSTGILSDSIITNLSNDSITKLFGLLKDTNKWNDVRKWCAENIDNDFALIMRALYDKSNDYIKPSSIPQLVLTLSEFDDRMSKVVDREISMCAMLTSLMTDLEFK